MNVPIPDLPAAPAAAAAPALPTAATLALADPEGPAAAPADPSPERLRRLMLALWASGESVWEWQAAHGRLSVDGALADPAGQAPPGAGRGSSPPQADRGGTPLVPESGRSPLVPDTGLRALADGRTVDELVAGTHADDRETLRLAWSLHLRGVHPALDISFRHPAQGAAGARLRWLRLRGRAIARDAQGHATHLVGTLEDVTSQREAHESLSLMGAAFASTRDPMAVVDAHWAVLEFNDAMRALVDDATLARGADLQRWIGPADSVLTQVLHDGLWRDERTLTVAAGPLPVETSITAVMAEDGHRRCFLVALHDLRERRALEERLHNDARLDPLTRLPNRLGAQWHADRLLAVPGVARGLLFIDLDGFKELCDSYGHEQGDRLLAALGERLTATLGDTALLARWGADEFLLMLPDGSGDTELRAAAQSVLAALAQPFEVNGHALSVTATLGAVLVPQDGNEFNTLMRRADLAVRAGKARGRNCLVFYDDTLDDNAERRVRMTSLLRADTDRNAFRFVAQPKVDADGQPVGLELLMRWNTEPFGSVSPVEFIPLAEKVGLIQMMGRHAAHAAAQLAAQGAELGCALPVAVNLSPKQLLQPGLDALLLHACRRHGIAPAMLDLELTESALVHNMEVVAPMLRRLRSLGFSLALDDFGTGYSSLSYLRHLPFDKVKIDRSFVLDIDRDPAAARMLESIVQLCKALRMRIVAEGVETRQQADALATMGVQEFQGYHFARPMPADDWLQLLRNGHGQAPRLPLPTAAAH